MFTHPLTLNTKTTRIGSIPELLWKEFVYGGHLQSLGSAGVVWMSSLVLNIPISLDILLVTYLLFYPIYLFNRIKELDIDTPTNPTRSAYLSITKKFLGKLFWIFPLVPITGLFLWSAFPGVIMGLFILLFGILYTFYFKNLTKIIAGFKNYYVASVFAVLIFFPFFYYGYALREHLVATSLLALWVLGKIITMQVILDLKDIKSDLDQNLKTFPVLLGKNRLFRILPWLIIFVTLPIPLVFSLIIPVFHLPALGLLLSIFITWYALHLTRNNRYEGYLLESGELISWPLFIFILQSFLP